MTQSLSESFLLIMSAAMPTNIASNAKTPPNAGLSSSLWITTVNSTSTDATPSDMITSDLASVVRTYISERL